MRVNIHAAAAMLVAMSCEAPPTDRATCACLTNPYAISTISDTATTSLATRFSGQGQAVWYGAGMKLTAGDFPLRAIGVHIYARSQSSPVLTADWPERAEQITAWLNAHEGLIASMAQNGPTLVTMGGHDHLAHP